jgi:hypothetical protein
MQILIGDPVKGAEATALRRLAKQLRILMGFYWSTSISVDANSISLKTG